MVARVVILHCRFDRVLIFCHREQIKVRGTDSEIGGVVIQWMMHFEISDAQRHHDVGTGMGFREHVLDFLAGLQIPFRHIVLPHCRFKILGQSFTFTHRFHDLEGK